MTKEEKLQQNHNQRLVILNRIKEKEKIGGEAFFEDVEDDPEPKELKPEDVDYLYKKPGNKFKNWIAVHILGAMIRKHATKEYNITVEGKENLEGITGGAILTSNHFAYFESGCVSEVCKLMNKKKKLYIVIREGNYTFPGIFGFLFRYCDTLPLSRNLHTMKNLGDAVKEVLEKEQYILVYPEQAMWWNYRKPRPHRTGAATFAAKNNVPLIPCFVTMSDQEKMDENGFPVQNYTIHVMKPLYADPNLSYKKNGQIMSEKNYQMCIDKYEEVYGKKLVYGEEE